MSKIRLLDGKEAGTASPTCWIDIGCTVCGINICDICLCNTLICSTECGCETYVPPCIDCSPVE